VSNSYDDELVMPAVHRHCQPAQAAVLDIGAIGDLVVAVKLELNVRPIELKSVPKILARCVEALETWGLILPLPNFVLSRSFIVPQGADRNG